jgi:EAL domain-containing protein (putative c-di-GMP-specific phosphodiesterase class I)/FixJ family two-component response regulator
MTTLPTCEILRERLPGALERGEMTLSYRPQVCLASGSVVGAEVALTWAMPTVGDVPSQAFLPLMEDLGLGEPLFRWVLQTACAQAVCWHQDGIRHTRLCVGAWEGLNIDGGLVSAVKGVLSKTGLPAHGLAIGLPLQALLQDVPGAGDALSELRTAGVETVATGFGADPCDLAGLSRLPLDLVKIDASMDPVGASTGALTLALIQFAHGMQWRVLVDGVGSEEQLQTLAGQGGDFAQGPHIGLALAPVDFETHFSGWSASIRHATQRHERQRTLLLVDDEENILSALKRLFRRDGYRVLTATSGMQGLEVLAENSVDVILSDQRMPGMAGVDFLRHAKDLYPNTIRMTLSGYTDLQSIIDAVNEGAVYKFLTKPWEDERLRDHVALAFRQCELAEENLRLGQEVSAVNRELANANQRLERMVAVEHERRRAMQVAAGASRDMLDLLPMAVFGVGAEGMLAYANRCAIRDWPMWASALGDEPEPQLLELMATLDEAGGDGVPDEGLDLGLDGRQVTAWKRRLAGEQDDLGSLLILHESKSLWKCEMEPSS